MRNIRRRPINFVLAILTAFLASWVAPGAQRRADAGQGARGLSSIRFFSQAELKGVHQSVFETLFLQPWEEDNWEYPLVAEVRGRGIYLGTNQYGQEFQLEIKVFAQVDLKQLVLQKHLRQWASDNAFTVAGAIGELRHGDARVRVHGNIVSSRNAEGKSSWRFWLSNTIAPDSAIFDGPRPVPPLTDAPKPGSKAGDATSVGGGADACTSGCARTKNNAIRAAGQTYDNTVGTADMQRDIAVAAAQQIYSSEASEADEILTAALLAATAGETACLLVCAASSPAPPVALACVAGCAVGYVVAVALANATYASNVGEAANRRDIAINAANQTFNVTLNAAEMAYGQALDSANQNYADCLADCGNPGGGGPGPIQEPED